MAMQSRSETAGATPIKAAQYDKGEAFPLREYVSAMALELAQMARCDGDEALARILESAATMAGEALLRPTAAPAT